MPTLHHREVIGPLLSKWNLRIQSSPEHQSHRSLIVNYQADILHWTCAGRLLVFSFVQPRDVEAISKNRFQPRIKTSSAAALTISDEQEHLISKNRDPDTKNRNPSWIIRSFYANISKLQLRIFLLWNNFLQKFANTRTCWLSSNCLGSVQCKVIAPLADLA